MPRNLPRSVRENIEKCQMSTISAVETYNRPGRRFRTAQFLVMIMIAWTALFHAIFFRRNINPWYKRGSRYERIDGEPKHWSLSECLSKHYRTQQPPERKNLEFLLGLRNKIEHRHIPELDPSLYGECQAALLNLEELLVKEFGEKYSLEDQLAISLQFSSVVPEEKRRATRALAMNTARSVKEYIEMYRGNLPSTVLSSMKYSFNVFLVPKVANRKGAADAAVEYIRVDEASTEQLDRLEKLNVLIREKKIPIANLELIRPTLVIDKVNEISKFKLTLNSHTDLWRHYKVRPKTGSSKPEKCETDFCVYDKAHSDYLYTNAWIRRCQDICNNKELFRSIIKRDPIPNL